MSDERRKPFPFDEFEPKWQQTWDEEKTFRTPNPGDPDFDASKPKFYVLDMFPYPSGSGLHVGHPEGYTATDIIGRTKFRQGFNVLHPMGWDSFGLPAEQYAIKTGQHPRVTTEANIVTFKRQLKSLGFGYDWDREVATTDPEYVRWTQWIFLQLYQSYFNEETRKAAPVSELEARGWTPGQIDGVRLAYIHEAPVNWSPDLGTVLANEEVEEWKSKGHTVERRPLRQWMLRITKYAQRLIDELDPLDWPEGIKLLQKNWIGRSEGAEVKFQVSSSKFQIEVFTTRPDTLFGATYMVLAPEHPLVAEITTDGQQEAVAAYQKACASKSDMERGDLNKDKTGVFTGGYAVNPVNDEKIPVWIADYVMMGYGTGAIMAVPAHDERDFEFATKFELPITAVVAPKGSEGVPPSPSSAPITRYFHPEGETHKTRINLPHWHQDDTACFVTWRTADSLPSDRLRELRRERQEFLEKHPEPWSDEVEAAYHDLFSDRIDAWLDAGHGECLLKDPRLSGIVMDALRHFDGDRYALHAAVVMPNHVHVLFSPRGDHRIQDILQAWKSFTAKAINRATDRDGEFWQRDYFDRLVRHPKHAWRIARYIDRNPVKAGLPDGEFALYPASGDDEGGTPSLPFFDPGIAINSGFIDGLPTAEAKAKMIDWLEAEGKGVRKIQYKLRDWLFSRQRYWGEPFPLLWNKETGGHSALPEDELPLLQPEMEDFKPTGDPRGPLAKATDWIHYSDKLERETNTMPQWAGSCWYYLRYCDPRNNDRFISNKAERYWSGTTSESSTDHRSPITDHSPLAMVDLYVGGTEHAVLHLLYARFWHKVLHDLGHLSTNEPFRKLVNQGLILGEDGQKMSKSRGNVVNPDEVVREYGADALRLYEMFMGPLTEVKPWQMKGVEGVSRFLARVWRVAMEQDQAGEWTVSSKLQDTPCTDKALLKVVHETVKKVTDDIAKLSFNTAISQMMVCTNAFTAAEVVPLAEFKLLLSVLNPFAPHLSEEINSRIGGESQLATQPWPEWDDEALVESEIEMVVQVNGKLRDRITVAKDAPKEAIEAAARATGKVREHTAGKTIRKVIVVPGRLVNIVAN